MKNLFVLFVCTLLVLSLSACVPDKDDEPADSNSPSIVEEPNIDASSSTGGSASDAPRQNPSAPKGSIENPIAEEPQESSAPIGSIDNPIAEEPQDPSDTIVEQQTKEQYSNIPTPDPSAPIGSAENPIAGEPSAD